MSFCAGGVGIARRAARRADIPVALLPAFLCPGILKTGPAPQLTRCFQSQRNLHTTETSQKKTILSKEGNWNTSRPLASSSQLAQGAKLPVQCPGCGAFSHIVEKNEPGFYTLTRGSMRALLQGDSRSKMTREREMLEKSLKVLGSSQEATEEQKGMIRELRSAFAQNSETKTSYEPTVAPLCDRCHRLKHHETGVSIHHPSVQSLQDTIFESPHKYNHIYHIIDAADFPMSLVQGLHRLLHLTPQRSLNRRSQTGRFYHGRKTEVSFIVTRSDLLAPTKEQVDKMMPYLRTVLRDALGRAAQDARLGNVRCVSAKRQWWTKELKDEIWNRGGGGWMVGKVNVGKSQLFQEVFPKGRMGDWGKHTTVSTALGPRKGLPMKFVTQDEIVDPVGKTAEPGSAETTSTPSETVEKQIQESGIKILGPESASSNVIELFLARDEPITSDPKFLEVQRSSPDVQPDELDVSNEPLNTTSLLPPLPNETDYPAMPLVSSLPGTTASPIRVPFGNGKGELIDLPGLSRGDLELHVQPEHRSSLLMRSRVIPKQHVLKCGQSFLLGGLIRITPTTPDTHILAYNFTPMEEHQTSNEKAVGIQSGTRDANVLNIAAEGTESKIESAGKFYLKWDVTRARTGPITRGDAVGIKVERLPFRVLGLDILIEGVGWVELAAQVRKPYGYQNKEDGWEIETQAEQVVDPTWPEVEVFSPQGRFVGQRRPMNAWLKVGEKPGKTMKARPRKAMKGAKKTEKMRAKAQTSPL